jgi:hypothetical protein
MRSMSGLAPKEEPAVTTSSFFSSPVAPAQPVISAQSILSANPVISAASILNAQPTQSAQDSAVQHTLDLLRGVKSPVAAPVETPVAAPAAPVKKVEEAPKERELTEKEKRE